MMGSARPGIAPVGWSIALHAVLVGLLYLGLTLPTEEPEVLMLPIDAVIADQAVLQAARQQRREDDRQAAEQRRREEAVAEQRAEEEARVEREANEQRVAQEEKLRVEAAEKKSQAAADAKRKAEADAKRRAEQQAAAKAAADKKRAQADAEQRKTREAELKALLANEDARTGPAFQGLKASYVRAIQAHVEQRWFEPPGMAGGMSCTVFVSQIPGGEVVGSRFGPCNGGEAVRQSIETAIQKASPLPVPPEPALFEREVKLVFTPKEK